MEKIVTGMALGIGGIILVGALALVGGTLVWLLWPVAVPAAFPGLVASGVLAGKVGWWASVCLTWLCGLLIKGSTTVNSKNN